jgi:outer membrane protein OmpA-like peptidoglycan-associated protein
MTASRLCTLALLAALAACSTPAPAPAPAPGAPASLPAPVAGTDPRSAAPRPAIPPSPLAGEQRFLDGWFGGTPVLIALQANGALGIDVPLLNAFNAGLAEPKPALVAVLDRVGESLRRQSQTRVTVSAPSDGPGNAALAQARAQRVRELLVARNVAATRVSVLPGAASVNFVQMRIIVTAAPIGRLDDATLPVPASGVRPTSTAKPASAPMR